MSVKPNVRIHGCNVNAGLGIRAYSMDPEEDDDAWINFPPELENSGADINIVGFHFSKEHHKIRKNWMLQHLSDVYDGTVWIRQCKECGCPKMFLPSQLDPIGHDDIMCSVYGIMES